MPPVEPALSTTEEAALLVDPIFTVATPVVFVAIWTVAVPPVVEVSAIPMVSLLVPVAWPMEMILGDPAIHPVVTPIVGQEDGLKRVDDRVHESVAALSDVR